MDEPSNPPDRTPLKARLKSRLKSTLHTALNATRDAAGNAARNARSRLRAVRALAGSPTGRRVMAVSGTVLSLILVLVLAGLPGSTPEQERTTLELTGKDLFEAIMEQNPVLRLNSRIATPAERGSADNLLVLPDATWQKLKVNERNSLGAWLNTLGRSWEIRVGVLSEDGSRVLDPQPVITSRAWNQQVK